MGITWFNLLTSNLHKLPEITFGTYFLVWELRVLACQCEQVLKKV